MAWESGAQPVIVRDEARPGRRPGGASCSRSRRSPTASPVHTVSGITEEGLDALKPYLGRGQTVALLGSSGVGKSTLVNALAGREVLRTREVRSDGRGRHTTTHRELVPLPGGALLLDTPGMRELQLWEAPEGLAATFADVEELAAACRFADCAHETEPGCADPRRPRRRRARRRPLGQLPQAPARAARAGRAPGRAVSAPRRARSAAGSHAAGARSPTRGTGASGGARWAPHPAVRGRLRLHVRRPRGRSGGEGPVAAALFVSAPFGWRISDPSTVLESATAASSGVPSTRS